VDFVRWSVVSFFVSSAGPKAPRKRSVVRGAWLILGGMSKQDSLIESEQQPSRYIVGIDLGTTNSAVGYVDTHREPWRVQTFLVPQLVDVGQVEARETLPSFHYQPAAGERAGEGVRLPWHRETPDHVVGVLAREQGARSPGG
jgi:molecular chaperone DnaK (HSP70)